MRTFRGMTALSALLLVTGCASNDDERVSHAPAGVTVVPHQTLETFLPNLAGWQRGEVRGETDTTESVSRITVDYDKPPSTLSFEFMDSSMNPDVLALINDAIKGRNSEMTPTMLKGFPGAEEWTGETMPDLASVRAAAETIDLAKMAALK